MGIIIIIAMKKYLFIIIALTFYGFSKTNLSKFRKVEIYQGMSVYGNQSLKLTEDGLLMRNDAYLLKNKKNKVSKFISLFNLDKKKLGAITNYIDSYNGFDNFVIPRDSLKSISSWPRTYIIRTHNYEKIKILIDYEKNCKELDSLKILMNDLIPCKYKKKYSL